MRVVCGFVAAAMLVALAQPALALCVYRGSTRTCVDDGKFRYWTPSPGTEAAGPEVDTSTDGASLKTIVMQSGSPEENAWVMTPGDGAGAMTPRLVDVAVPACEPGTSC